MDISLIVCTRNRGTILASHLESLEKLVCTAPFEIIIVNNGSVDNTSHLLKQFQKTSTHNIVICKESEPGLSKARNHGISIAKGDIIAFTDDDCYPQPDYIQQVYNIFKYRPHLGFIGGKVLLYDNTDKIMAIQPRDITVEIHPGSFIKAGYIHGANFAFRREALISIGGFDEQLGLGSKFASAEDVDILTRLSFHGIAGAYVPDPVVYHHHRRKTMKQYVTVRKRNVRGRGAYYAKCLLNPDIRKQCILHWLGRMKKRPLMEIILEIRTALEYWYYIKTSKDNAIK